MRTTVYAETLPIGIREEHGTQHQTSFWPDTPSWIASPFPDQLWYRMHHYISRCYEMMHDGAECLRFHFLVSCIDKHLNTFESYDANFEKKSCSRQIQVGDTSYSVEKFRLNLNELRCCTRSARVTDLPAARSNWMHWDTTVDLLKWHRAYELSFHTESQHWQAFQPPLRKCRGGLSQKSKMVDAPPAPL